MNTYTVKVVLCHVRPLVWWRFRLSGETSLAAFHYIIQIAREWHDDHLHQFRICGRNYGISYSGDILFPDNPCKITLDDFEFDIGDRFIYEYDFFENLLHDICTESVHTHTSQKVLFCLASNEMPGATVADERGDCSPPPVILLCPCAGC
ncbi:hypothetical protein C6H65_17495 [Photorhabdus luminescens]|nr:hypothetical protein C6H65_17495 [Photorhabdus luminescens]